jgi:hypothetical protein
VKCVFGNSKIAIPFFRIFAKMLWTIRVWWSGARIKVNEFLWTALREVMADPVL